MNPSEGQSELASPLKVGETAPGNRDQAAFRAARDAGNTAWSNNHFINIRLSIPLFFTSLYITVVAGTERRSRERRRRERAKHPLGTLGNLLCMGYAGMTLALACAAILITAIIVLIRQMFDVELVLH